jgi:hypothetical protein
MEVLLPLSYRRTDMPEKKQPNPTEQVLDSLVMRQLEHHPSGLTQTNLITKFRSPSPYGPRFTFHPNAIKKAVARLAIAGKVSVSPAGNDVHLTLAAGKEASHV